MRQFFDFLLKYKEIVIFILTTIVGLIPILSDIKSERNGRKVFNKSAGFFIFFTLILFMFTIYGLYVDKQSILQKDIRIVVQLQTNKFYPETNKLTEKLNSNSKIFVSRIKFGNAQTSGTFDLENIKYAGSRGTPFPIIVYKCNDIKIDDIKEFPKDINDLTSVEVEFKFPMERFDKENFYLMGLPILLIKDKEYYGSIEKGGLVLFKID